MREKGPIYRGMSRDRTGKMWEILILAKRSVIFLFLLFSPLDSKMSISFLGKVREMGCRIYPNPAVSSGNLASLVTSIFSKKKIKFSSKRRTNHD